MKLEFNPDEVWYVVDGRQELHFKQIFRAAYKSGIAKPETVLYHAGFGTMNGKDGKPFKTREGGVMRLEKLIELAQRLETGGGIMDFNAFDKKELESYAEEAKKRWGGSKEYKESKYNHWNASDDVYKYSGYYVTGLIFNYTHKAKY